VLVFHRFVSPLNCSLIRFVSWQSYTPHVDMAPFHTITLLPFADYLQFQGPRRTSSYDVHAMSLTTVSPPFLPPPSHARPASAFAPTSTTPRPPLPSRRKHPGPILFHTYILTAWGGGAYRSSSTIHPFSPCVL
jgi:hypothetical protein